MKRWCAGLAALPLALALASVALLRAAAAAAAAAPHLSLDVVAPRPSSGGPRGFPARPLVFEFAEPEPLSAVDRARWAVLSRAGVDARWREERLRPGALRTTERYNSVDLLGGITRVGEYYTTILVGGQKVRVQVDVSLLAARVGFRDTMAVRCIGSAIPFWVVCFHSDLFCFASCYIVLLVGNASFRRDQARWRFLLRSASTVRSQTFDTI